MISLLLIVSAFLLKRFMSECLSNTTLTDLGFTNLVKQNYTNSSMCASVFNDKGGCVSGDNLMTYLARINDMLRFRIGSGSSFVTIINQIQGRLVNVASANSTNATAEVTLQVIKQNLINNIDSCLRSLALIHHGAYCLLASQSASQFVTDMGSFLEIKTNLTSVGTSLDACLPLIDATCLAAYGNPISSKAVYNISSTNVLIDISNATCSDLKYQALCNATNCATSRRAYLVNKMFSSNDIKFAPKQSTLDKIIQFYNQLLNKATNSGSRRLGETKSFRLTAEAAGSDLISIGVSSGVEPASTSGSSLTALAISFALSLASVFLE